MRRCVSFCFDDGFLSSSRKTLKLFDERQLKASFCVSAMPAHSDDAAHQGAIFADWNFWRDVQSAGHEVAPHGWAHERLAELPLTDAKLKLIAMFDLFERQLPGFSRANSVYHAAYMAMPLALGDWLLDRVKALRVAADWSGQNSFADVAASGCINCTCSGPTGVAEAITQRIVEFERSTADWLVLVFHGLDGEGWGAIAEEDLAATLDYCLAAGHEIAPVGHALSRCRLTRWREAL